MVLLVSELEASINAREGTNYQWRTFRYLGTEQGGRVVVAPCPDFHSEVLTPIRIRAVEGGGNDTTLILPLMRLRGSDNYSDTPPDTAGPEHHVYLAKWTPAAAPTGNNNNMNTHQGDRPGEDDRADDRCCLRCQDRPDEARARRQGGG